MSSNNFAPQGHFLQGEFSMLNYELVENIDFDKEIDESEQKKIDELYSAKLEIKEEVVIKKELKTLDFYFATYK